MMFLDKLDMTVAGLPLLWRGLGGGVLASLDMTALTHLHRTKITQC
ncbi:MAG: hypothetical protein LBS12_03285 [Prevotellaceae bacterium]|jgi:hypothetical protein|nr:hypothetical protein [Prevotellaceae bacterium]